MDENRGIHREVAIHVLNYIPLSPLRHQMSKWPLGFMTQRCNEAHSRRLKNPNKPPLDTDFSDIELDLSGKLLPWTLDLPNLVREEITPETWTLEQISAQSKESRLSFYPPIVIRSKSGHGKSMLLGKVVAELLDAKYSEKEESDWPIYNRIVYSQIKDQSAASLEQAICNGMDDFHKQPNLDWFFEETKEAPPGEKILFIDSLDEHPDAEEWWNISLRLSDNGWRVVWTCRDPDWTSLSLGSGKENFYNPSDGNSKYHWNRFTGKTWDLNLTDDRKNELKIKGIEWGDDDESKNVRFLEKSYEKTQLMHMFHTNLDLVEHHRTSLDNNLVRKLFEKRDEIVTKEKRPDGTSRREHLQIFNAAEWYHQFFDANLAKIIIDTSLEYVSKVEDRLSDKDVKQAWHLVCNRYFEYWSEKRREGQLNEKIIGVEEEDIRRLITQETMNESQQDKLKQNIQILLDYLLAFGILRESDGEKKFRHRDFAVIAYVNGSDSGILDLNKTDTIFSYFFPHPDFFPESTSDQDSTRMQDFLRRTGNVTSQIESLWTLPKLYHDMPDIARKSITLILMKESETETKHINKGISGKQRQSIELGQDKTSIVLHGVPGSGKTFSGVERIIYRQANLFSEGIRDSYALVVSLNDELAKSIHEELNGQHKNSPFLFTFNHEEKNSIIATIQVRSIKQIIEEWMPSVLDTRHKTDWLITEGDLEEMFNTLRNRPGIKLETRAFRWLQHDYQNKMFDTFTGMFCSLDAYLGTPPPPGSDLDPDIRKNWHDVVRLNRENGKIPLQEACAFLRNQLLSYEFENSYETHFDLYYETTSESIKFDEEKSFTIFDEKFQNGFYDCIMVDEVQDLPVIAVNMLSFLSPSREPNRFILAGDKYQTLNGQNFDWYDFLFRLTAITKQLTKDHKFIYSDANNKPADHHLKGFFWTEGDIDNVILNRLDENFRNHPAINELTMYSWKNWPSSEYYNGSNKNNKKNNKYPFTEMKSRFKRSIGDEDFTPLMVIDSQDRHDFINKIGIILESVNSRSGVSLLCTNHNLRDYVRKLMDEGYERITTVNGKRKSESKKDTSKLRVETFDPWTIKGLERNAVVILGGYTVSPRGTDTQDIFEIDFSRKNKYSDFSATERDTIDLMRRKMLVSQTRAVEQLIVLNTPFQAEINLGSIDEKFKSINSMDFTDMGTEYNVKYVTEEGQLAASLFEFFKGSKIQPIHISIKRLSEGLKLKNRMKSDSGKKEFANYKTSLNNILSSDVNDSELRKLMSQLTSNGLNADISKHNLISDLIKISIVKRSYYSKPKTPEEHKKDVGFDDDYTNMTTAAYQLENIKSGPWTEEGFDLLRLVVDAVRNFDRKLNEISTAFFDEYKDSEREDIFDDINRVIGEIKSVITDFSNHYNLPKIDKFTILKSYLGGFLLSTENKLSSGKYPRIGFKDVILGKQIVENLQQSNFGINNDGNLILSMGKDKFFTIVGETWVRFLEDLNKLELDSDQSDDIIFLSFSMKLIEVYDEIRSLIVEENKSPMEENTRFLDAGNAISLRNLIKKGQSSDIDAYKQQILQFIREEFPGARESAGVAEFLNSLQKSKPNWLDEYISNKLVLSWSIENFMHFQDILTSNLYDKRRQNRSIQLYNLSGHVRDWISSSIGIAVPIYEIAENLLKSEHLTHYQKMIGKIGLSVAEKSTSKNLEIENLIDMVVYTQALKLADKSYDEEPSYGSSKLHIKTTLDSFSKKEKKKLRNQAVDFIIDLLDDLRRLESNPDYIVAMKSGKAFIRQILFLRGICEDRIPAHDKLANVPSLQKLNIFNLQKISTYPDDFMPDMRDEKSERNWIESNQNKVFFPKQQNPLEQLILVAHVLDNWNLNYKLHSVLSTIYKDGDASSEKLYWNNDGFGRILDFDAWVEKNNQFDQFLESNKQIESSARTLHDKFDLDSRVKRYVQVIHSTRKVLDAREGKTVKVMPLLRDIVVDLFNLKSEGNTQFQISTLPNNSQLKINVDENTADTEILSWSGVNPPEFVRLVWDLIGHDGEGQPERKFGIKTLDYYEGLFGEFLGRHQKETAEHVEQQVKHGRVIVDDTFQKFLDGETAILEPNQVPVDVPIQDKDNTFESGETDDQFVSIDDLDAIMEGETDDFVSIDDLDTIIDDKINDDQNFNSFTDPEVMGHFNISEYTWDTMTEEGRQALRHDYSKKR